MFKKECYQARRNRLKQLIPSGVILLPSNSSAPFNGPESSFPFRQDSSFLYFAGIDQPDLTLLIDADSGDEYLFGTECSPDSLFWSGKTPSLADYCQKSGIDRFGLEKDLPEVMARIQEVKRQIHILPPYQGEVILKLQHWLGLRPDQLQETISDELIRVVIQLRSIKEENEIKEIETAVDIAYKMHTTAMIMAMPGAYEQEIKGVIEGLAVSAGGSLSFQPIVTMRGDILHNPRYTNTLESAKLLVVDAGAESPLHYASDITRTIPVGRTFTRLQRNIYEVVLKANLAAIEAIKPQIPFKELHHQAALMMTKGLKDLGLMKGDPEEAVKEGAHALFFPHGLGHMLGLDTHDMESLGEDAVGYDETFTRSQQFGLNYLRLAKPLAAGNVVTVEPGIYFIPPLVDAWKQEKRFPTFINYDQVDLYMGMGGVRIEDNILVTQEGSRVLGRAIPKTVKEIESY